MGLVDRPHERHAIGVGVPVERSRSQVPDRIGHDLGLGRRSGLAQGANADGTNPINVLPGHAIVLPGSGPATTGNTPLLDGAIFQNLFRSGVVTLPPSVTHGGSTMVAGEQGDSQAPAPQGTQGLPDGAAGPQDADGLTAMQLTILDDLGQPQSGSGLGLREVIAARREDDTAQENVSIAAGAAGLMAAHGLRGKSLLDRNAMAGTGAQKAGMQPLARKALDAITRKWFGGGSQDVAQRGEIGDSPRPQRSRIEW